MSVSSKEDQKEKELIACLIYKNKEEGLPKQKTQMVMLLTLQNRQTIYQHICLQWEQALQGQVGGHCLQLKRTNLGDQMSTNQSECLATGPAQRESQLQ